MDRENHGFGLSVVCAQSVIVCIAKINVRNFDPILFIVVAPLVPLTLAL
jgi:hypothetical protein